MTRWIRTLGACAAGLISCGDPSLPADSPGEPPRDLIVIVLDALPASSVSAYGYGRETTPHLDALAAGGQRFEAAFTSASYTLASTASLVAGMTPRGHGVEAEDGQVLRHIQPAVRRDAGEQGLPERDRRRATARADADHETVTTRAPARPTGET